MSETLRCRKCGKVFAVSDLPDKITSVDVARIFHKQHRDVMRDIRKILASGIGLRNFAQSSYTNKQKKWQPCYEIDREGFRILSTRYRARGPTPDTGCIEVKNGKRVVKIHGIEPVEFICDRCGTVNVF